MRSAPMAGNDKLNVFVSYSHDDDPRWLERVQKHLKPLARDGKLELWDDTRIKGGDRWRQEIKDALAKADVAVLLISADFYASDFITKDELPPLLEAERERGLKILGVHINPSRFDRDEVLSEYQTINPPGKPVGGLPKTRQEKVFDDLARRIEELVPRSRSGPPPIPPEYLAWFQGRCADVALLGQDIQKGHAFTLSHIYVPALTLPDEAVAPEGRSRRQRAEPEQRRPVTLLERLDQVSLYVPAPAGAGKSTFCRWASLQSIEGTPTSHPVPAPEGFQEPVPATLRGRLPLLVPLRDFAMGIAWPLAAGGSTGNGAICSRRWPPGSTVRPHRALAVVWSATTWRPAAPSCCWMVSTRWPSRRPRAAAPSIRARCC